MSTWLHFGCLNHSFTTYQNKEQISNMTGVHSFKVKKERLAHTQWVSMTLVSGKGTSFWRSITTDIIGRKVKHSSLSSFQVLCAQPVSCVQLFVTPRIAAHQAPLSMGFSKQEFWSGLPLPSLNVKEKVKVKSVSHVRLCDPMDCSLPGSSVHGIFQARVLEWVAIDFSSSFQTPGNTFVFFFFNG